MWRLPLKISFWNPFIYKFQSYCRCLSPGQSNDILFQSSDINCCVFPNGLVVASQERDTQSACITLTIDAGARYETSKENGLTHFFEHMCFKGTNKRSKADIENEMNEIGGKFKCHTSREMISYSVQCFGYKIPQAMDLLTDCIFNNAFCNSEIEIQKCVVYQEMLEHDKDSSSVVWDYLHKVAFHGTGLGQSVIGPTVNLYNFSCPTMSAYIKKMFVPSRISFTCVGPVGQDQVLSLAQTYLNRSTPDPALSLPYRFTGGEIRYRDDSMIVAHFIMAVEAPPFNHADYLPMLLACTAIGSWDKSQPGTNHSSYFARAASSGICNCFKSFYIPYKDTGLWGIELISPLIEAEIAVEIVQGQWKKLCTMLTDAELIKTKQQLKWQILKQHQSSAGACEDIATWVHFTKNAPTIHERFLNIDKINAKDVMKACDQYIYDRCVAVAAMGATETLTSYSRLRGNMNWLRL